MTDIVNHPKRENQLPRTEEANQKIREAQRLKILEAAKRVFARKGTAATMADVAAEAGVSYGLAYRYFRSKEALFRALIDQMLQWGPSAWQRFLEMPGTPGKRLEYLISRLVENRRDSPGVYQLFRQVLGDEGTPDDLRARVRRHGQAFRTKLRQLIIEGQTTREVLDGDPDQLVFAVEAFLDGLTHVATSYPARMQEHFPDAGIVLRILKP